MVNRVVVNSALIVPILPGCAQEKRKTRSSARMHFFAFHDLP